MNGTDFLQIARAMNARGFAVTPVHPTEKSGVLYAWNRHPATTISEIAQLAKDFPHHHVGVVSRRGIGNLCFLDIDATGVVEQIEKEAGRTMPDTFVVQSQPHSNPHKQHFYFRQTTHSHATFTKEITGIKDLKRLENDRFVNRYDFKGIGGGGYVVAPGSVRHTGETYTIKFDRPIADIPDWLVNWIRDDVRKYRSETAKLRAADERKHAEAMQAAQTGGSLPEYSPQEIYTFLWSRAWSYAPLGTRRESLERLLREQMEDFMRDGKKLAAEWRERIHEIAHNPTLRIGKFRKEFLGKLRRPISIKPEEPVTVAAPAKGTQAPENIILRPTVHRYEVMTAEIAAFPPSLPAVTVYARLGAAVRKVGLALDPDDEADQAAVQRRMQKAGYGCRNIDGAWMWAKEWAKSAHRQPARRKGRGRR
jgi:Bifunctional DNA primase/polymerase, N-terminal